MRISIKYRVKIVLLSSGRTIYYAQVGVRGGIIRRWKYINAYGESSDSPYTFNRESDAHSAIDSHMRLNSDHTVVLTTYVERKPKGK